MGSFSYARAPDGALFSEHLAGGLRNAVEPDSTSSRTGVFPPPGGPGLLRSASLIPWWTSEVRFWNWFESISNQAGEGETIPPSLDLPLRGCRPSPGGRHSSSCSCHRSCFFQNAGSTMKYVKVVATETGRVV